MAECSSIPVDAEFRVQGSSGQALLEVLGSCGTIRKHMPHPVELNACVKPSTQQKLQTPRPGKVGEGASCKSEATRLQTSPLQQTLHGSVTVCDPRAALYDD